MFEAFEPSLLIATGEGAPSTTVKRALLDRMRSDSPDRAQQLDAWLIERASTMAAGLDAAKQELDSLREQLERMSAPPLVPAVYLAPAALAGCEAALVACGESCRIVPLADDVDRASLARGTDVLLDAERALLVAASSELLSGRCGETAVVEHTIDAERLLVRTHDDDTRVMAFAASLDVASLRAGDIVRIDRSIGLVREKIDRRESTEFVFERVKQLSLDSIGGQDDVVRRLIAALTLTIVAPAAAKAYGLDGQRTILLVGPPGTGKTLMARAAAAELERLTGKACRICIVKPGEFESPWVGVTQQRIRACFRSLRESQGPALLFLDEIESIGRARGTSHSQHGDSFLAALLAELQGFDADGRDDVAIVAATNRLDLLDAALAERMELKLHVRRPDRRGASAIFDIHLAATLPFAAGEGALSREELIGRAVTRLYGTSGESCVCTIRFADARERVIHAAELVSGRLIEQICRAARRSAAGREVEGGLLGIDASDLDDAVSDAIAQLGAGLTRSSVRHTLDDLPQDVDVVAVEPADTKRLRRADRFMRVA